jgi:hypothetical protein
LWLEYGYTAVLVVPTGIGASIGGYAGDALPVRHTQLTQHTTDVP